MLAKATKDSLAPTVALIRDRHEPFQPSAQGRATGNTGVSKTSESIPLGITEAPKLAKGSGGMENNHCLAGGVQALLMLHVRTSLLQFR